MKRLPLSFGGADVTVVWRASPSSLLTRAKEGPAHQTNVTGTEDWADSATDQPLACKMA